MADAEQVLDAQAETQEPEVETDGEQTTEAQPDYAKQIAGLEQALSETRQKSRNYEQELARVQGRLEQIGTTKPEKPTKKQFKISKDEFWSGEEESVNRAYQAAKEDALAEFRQEQAEKWQRRTARQEQKLMKKYPDYAEARQAFDAAAQYDRALVNEMLEEDNPAQFVYEWHQENKSRGDTSELQRKLKELEEENKALREGRPPPTRRPPKTQAGQRQAAPSSASEGGDPWAGNPLDQ